MKNLYVLFSIVVFVAIWFVACKPDVLPTSRVPLLPATPYAYDTPIGSSFFNPFGDSIIDNDVATLGRVLFYDTQLSKNNRTSCGTCHIQIHGFSDKTQWSIGFANGLTGRNTQTIVNTGTQIGFFWDLREATLDHMVLQPIANHVEMGIPDTLYMEEKVRRTSFYLPLFEKAFGNTDVSTNKIGRALAQFVKSIISINTKFDKGVMELGLPLGDAVHTDFPNFTEEENLGRFLFFEKFPCSTCHGGKNMNGVNPDADFEDPKNIGLELDYLDNGVKGLFDATLQIERDGFFKTPSLRNIALTAPYMHDGRFNTLEEVVEFYNSGIAAHSQLTGFLKHGEFFDFGPVIPPHEEPIGTWPLLMYMTSEEKLALVAFMRTLTDYELISDPKFNDPFGN